MYLKRILWLAPLLALLFLPIRLAAKDSFDLFSLSMEELSRIQVNIVNNRPENIKSSPAIVSRYTMSQLQAMGLSELTDVLTVIPGFVVDKGVFGNPQVMIRGAVENFNNKVLLLLDGVPYWSSSHSDIPLQGIPFNCIDYIEVIRGPGSVFYGSNAIAGVINIISKSESKDVVSATVGSNERQQVEGRAHWQFDEKKTLMLSVSYQDEDGFISEVDENAFYRRKDTHEAAYINFQHDDGQVLFSYFEQQVTGFTDLRRGLGISPKTESWLVHATHEFDFNGDTLNIFADFNQYELTSERLDGKVYFDNHGRDNYRLRTGFSYQGTVNNQSYMLGGEHEVRSVGNRFISTSRTPKRQLSSSDDIEEFAAYAQWQWQNVNWQLLLGARYTQNQRFGNKVTPRANLVYNLDSSTSLKLLYSVGFTSPNFHQATFISPSDPKPLTAETIEMWDLAYSLVTPTYLFVMNGYHYNGVDFLTRIPFPNTNLINDESFSRSGIEVDWQWQQKHRYYTFNLSYNAEGNKSLSDDQRAILVPRIVGNLGMYWQWEAHSLGFNINYISDRGTVSDKANMTANYTWRWANGAIELIAKNLFSDEMFSPDVGGVNTIPVPVLEDRINWAAKVSFQF